MLQNEILILLKENIRVIIPDLGAIMVKAGNGGLIFNEFLKFNDGLLINYIAKNKGIEKSEASKEVKRFTNDIIKCLAKDQKCDLEPVGTLYIDEDEKIQLRSSALIEPVNKENIKNETQKSEEPYNLSKPSLLQIENDTEASISTTIKEKIPMFDNVPLSKPENGNGSATDEYSYREKKPVWKILLISLAILAFMAVTAYFVFIEKPHFFSKKNNAFTTDTGMVAEPRETQPQIAETETSNVSEVPANIKGNKYHIIAGAFVIEKNASAFMQELQKKGFEPQIVLKRNEYSFISIFSYPTFREANEKFKTFEGTGMPIWIMKYSQKN